MSMSSDDDLLSRRCLPCEGLTSALNSEEILQQLPRIVGWEYVASPDRIRKSWVMKDFVSAIEFFRRVSELAEAESHHPDLHLTSYRNVSIEIWTHSVKGLSLNDFVLAARIDLLPVQLRVS